MVYVVFSGDELEIGLPEAVFSTREKAENFIKNVIKAKYRKTKGNYRNGGSVYEIIDYEVDEEA